MTKSASYIEGARLQRQFSEALEEDALFSERGGKIYYAVDSNVVIFLAQPYSMATSHYADGLRAGVSAIFDDDNPDHSAIVAGSLAEHIFFKLSGDLPLLVIPPINTEVQAYVNRVTARGTGPPQEFDRETFQEVLKEMGREDLTASEYERLIETAQMVLFLQSGAPADLRRLRNLLDHRRLASTDVLSSSSSLFPDDEVRSIIAPPTELSDIVRHGVAARNWLYDRLSVRPRRGPPVDRDAEAAARLELWNLRLERLSPPRRIVCITADRSLLDAGRRDDFTKKYLRHPRAYLTDLVLFQRGTHPNQTSLQDWLSLWSDSEGAGSSGDGVLSDELVNDLVAKWHEYVATAVLGYVPDLRAQALFYGEQRADVAAYSDRIEVLIDRINALQRGDVGGLLLGRDPRVGLA